MISGVSLRPRSQSEALEAAAHFHARISLFAHLRQQPSWYPFRISQIIEGHSDIRTNLEAVCKYSYLCTMERVFYADGKACPKIT